MTPPPRSKEPHGTWVFFQTVFAADFRKFHAVCHMANFFVSFRRRECQCGDHMGQKSDNTPSVFLKICKLGSGPYFVEFVAVLALTK